MKTIITALALLCITALIITGCAEKVQTPLEGGETNQPSTQESSTITGNIQEVDSLTNDLNDPDLQDTEEQLNEINW